jgi:thymidylate synthase (FAD)
MAGKTNRQGSLDVTLVDDELTDSVNEQMEQLFYLYEQLADAGVSRDTARMVLPESTTTKLCMNGTVREWITALNVRLYKTAQKEIRLIAQAIRDVLIQECPIISAALYNFEDAEMIYILDRLILEKYGAYNAVKANGWAKAPKP